MTSYSYSETFTRAHARKLAGRVSTDLHQSSSNYGQPTAARLAEYQSELEELLTGGYVWKYQFGFERADQIVWSLRYTVGPDGGLQSDSRGGGVPLGIDVTGASFFNSLTFSLSWTALTDAQRQAVQAKLPFTRSTKALPGSALGYWTVDRSYTAGGVLVEREVFRRAS